MSYQLNRMRRELDELREQSFQLEQELENEREARIQQTALQSLAGKVNRPEQFMQILRSEGSLVEHGGELLVKTNQGLCPLVDGAAELLRSADYEHFRTSSLNAPPSGASPTAETKGPILEGGDRLPDTQEMMSILSDPNRSQEMFSELQAMIGQAVTPARTTSTGLTAGQPTYDSVRPQTQGQFSTSNAMPSDVEIQQALNDPQVLDQLLGKYA